MAASKYIYHLSHLSTDIYIFFCWLGQKNLNGSLVKVTDPMVQLVGTWNEIITTDPNHPECNQVTMVCCFSTILNSGISSLKTPAARKLTFQRFYINTDTYHLQLEGK